MEGRSGVQLGVTGRMLAGSGMSHDVLLGLPLADSPLLQNNHNVHIVHNVQSGLVDFKNLGVRSKWLLIEREGGFGRSII